MTTTEPSLAVPAAAEAPPALAIKLYADGADPAQILRLADDPVVAGFTTNPTLMRASGVKDYAAFARELLQGVTAKPISFEVFADDVVEMYRQATEIASWGRNVYVKIPVTNTQGKSLARLVRQLTFEGVQVNVTAVFAIDQVAEMAAALEGGAPSIISVFAGRIADTGRDPVPHMAAAVRVAARAPNVEVLWASSREVLNLYQAASVGCHIITMTPDLLGKLSLRARDLREYSRATVRSFHSDAQAAGYRI